MSLLNAIFFGILQGVTEFLPVSSSGHLAIFKNIFGMSDVGIAFDILLHIGTLVAVCLVYWKDVVKLVVNGIGIIVDFVHNIVSWVKAKRGFDVEYRKVISSAYRKFVMLIVVSTIPTGIIGIITGDIIEAAGKTLIVPGICLLITGVILLIADELEEGNKTPKNTTYKNSIFVGIVQGFATLPGVSRSGSTIAACLACGFKREFAVKYSFIMSIPAILGAAILQIKDLGTEAVSGSLFSYLVGAVVAGAVGFVCIKTMLVIVKRQKFKYFSYYCFALGAISIITYFIK